MSRPFSENSYISKPQKPTLLGKSFPSAVFILSLVHVVIKAAAKCREKTYTGEQWVKDSLYVIDVLEKIGGTIEANNIDIVRNIEGPCVFVSNHMSTLETLILPAIIQPIKNLNIVVKRSLATYPIFGNIIRDRGSIIIDRKNPRDDFTTIMNEGAQSLAKGNSVLVFPQSTRNTEFVPAEFNSIGVKLARKAKVPLVPIAIHTATMGQGKWMKDYGTLYPHIPARFNFGEPITIEGNGKEAHAACIDFIQENLTKWKAANALL